MNFRLAAVALLMLAPLAHAADKAATPKNLVQRVSIEEQLKQQLEAKFPEIGVDMVRKSAYPGLYEAAMGDDVVYVSPDGKFLIFGGTMLGIEGQPINLTQISKAEFDAQKAPLRAAELAKLDKRSMLTFAAANEKYEINVFTDIDCGYCQKLHKDVPALNQLGITVHYLAYPRSGLNSPSHQKLVNVWCADNPQQAMTAAKNRQAVPEKTCKNGIEKHMDLVRKFGLSGTPAIVLNDGTLIGGYMPPQQLLAALEQNQPKTAAKKVSAVN